jgi:hypothetical protein
MRTRSKEVRWGYKVTERDGIFMTAMTLRWYLSFTVSLMNDSGLGSGLE